jgi:hypothetical protein
MGTSKPSVEESNVSQIAGSKASLALVGRIAPSHERGSRRAWHSHRSRVGIKFFDPINHTYRVGFPKYQNTENSKYKKV